MCRYARHPGFSFSILRSHTGGCQNPREGNRDQPDMFIVNQTASDKKKEVRKKIVCFGYSSRKVISMKVLGGNK